jgi:hypothetical protein
MRYILILLLACAGSLSAADFADAFERRPEPVNLFDAAARADIERGGQLFGRGPDSRDMPQGGRIALGFANDPIGFGMSTSFDFYFASYWGVPFVAASLHQAIAYGVITNEYEGGGIAYSGSLAIGGKFVFDFPGVALSRWFRPWVGLYPIGFRFADATEDVKLPGEPRREINYTDVFYLMQAGTGVDIFLTGNFALGAAAYVTATFGGSTHRNEGITVKTHGRIGLYIEYISLTIRF